MLNNQPPERSSLLSCGDLDIQEIFSTIQGEGPFAGTPAVFVRLAGCNLQCPWCDTDYTSKRETLSCIRICEIVKSKLLPRTHAYNPLVVITGGEPFRQNLTPLVHCLLSLYYRIQIETNGLYYLEGFPYSMVTVVCSPKTSRINEALAPKINAFKYVVQENQIGPDGLPLTTLGNLGKFGVARPPVDSSADIYVQPLDEKDPDRNLLNLNTAVASCLTFGYRLCVQTHKLANLP